MGHVKGSLGTICYGELIYVLQNDITFGLVQNREGAFVRADLESLTAAADAALADVPDDLRCSLTNAPGKKSYPICGTVWAIVYVNQPTEKQSRLVDFLRWCTHQGQQYTEGMHYGKLPASLVKRIDKKLEQLEAARDDDPLGGAAQ